MLASSSSSDFTLLSSSISSSKNNTTQKTMEDVWNDISIPNTPLTHIHTVHHPTPTSSSQFRGYIFQDFLSNNNNNNNGEAAIRSSIDAPKIRPIINSTTTEFQFLDNQFQTQGNSSVSPTFIAGVAALSSSSVLTSFCGGSGGGAAHNITKKRFPEVDEDGSGDRRHKRMIKNRESAARSRARKQAYITELQQEIEDLKKENHVLRNQHLQYQLNETPPSQFPKKYRLYRTSTAPF